MQSWPIGGFLFLVERLLACIGTVLAWFFLPDHSPSAKLLNEGKEETVHVRGLRRSGDAERVGGIVWKGLALTVLDAKAWLS